MTKTTEKYVFQTDSELVLNTFSQSKSYLVEYNEQVKQKKCVLYFSSNNIYFPNNATVFSKEIIKKNKYEWYGTRINDASKHIFIRDIKKQWYLNGINGEVNSPEKLFELLKKETDGYEITTLGSSAGGYAAVLFGQLLNAKHIYSFNGQFEINSLLNKSTESVDPIVFRNKNNKALKPYYDLYDFIKNPKSIYYFGSYYSTWDKEQYDHIKDHNLWVFRFITNHHGIPFLKSILPELLNMKVDDLLKRKGNFINPLLFSVAIGGWKKTIAGIKKIILKK